MARPTARHQRAPRAAVLRTEAKALALRLRAEGRGWVEIADDLRARYGLNARAAMRLAHAWTQDEVARLWNERWPDVFKTHKSISYWETWRPGPGKHGYAPSFEVLDRLAQIYSCTVSDLLVDLGDYRPDDHPPAVKAVDHTTVDDAPPSVHRTSAYEADPVVVASQNEWRQTRRYLNRHRAALARAVSRLYRPEIRLDPAPLLTPTAWMPPGPIELHDITLNWQPEPQPTVVDGTEPEAQLVCPLRSARFRYGSYTAAMRYVDPPALFENRPSYRLLDIGWTGHTGAMAFGLATYFDKLDISEALGHEIAHAAMSNHPDLDHLPDISWADLPFRRTIGDLFDLANRAVVPAITTLTLLRDRAAGDAAFILHWRDPDRVATAGGQYDVIPAGEFQPSSVVPWAHSADLDLWRNIVREYSEELCGTTEHDGSHGTPVDYDQWPFYRAMSRARTTGRLHAYCLGVGLDALTLAATIPTVVVIDDDAFAEIFGQIVHVNAEGVTVLSLDNDRATRGIPFTEANVERFLTSEPMAPPGAACLALAWRHRERLLGPGTC